MTKDSEFNGKVALISGAASGIGAATAHSLAHAGAQVILCDINPAVEAASEALRAQGCDTGWITGDTSNAQDCQAMTELAMTRFGRLDIAFNNAGIGSFKRPVQDITETDWRRLIDVNLTGVFLATKCQVPAMVSSGGGVIINNASILGLRAFPENSVEYTAAKHGVVGLSRQIALNHARDGIRCVAVCPGLIDTALTHPGHSPDVDE
ncbi:MAG: SDR family oxidoreductase, partial [Cellvibrionales bacterium]